MDPKPGAVQNEDRHNNQYIDPDFEVYWQSKDHNASSTGEFVIKLNQRNAHSYGFHQIMRVCGPNKG